MKTLLFASLLLSQVPAAQHNTIADYVVGPGDVLSISVRHRGARQA